MHIISGMITLRKLRSVRLAYGYALRITFETGGEIIAIAEVTYSVGESEYNYSVIRECNEVKKEETERIWKEGRKERQKKRVRDRNAKKGKKGSKEKKKEKKGAFTIWQTS